MFKNLSQNHYHNFFPYFSVKFKTRTAFRIFCSAAKTVVIIQLAEDCGAGYATVCPRIVNGIRNKRVFGFRNPPSTVARRRSGARVLEDRGRTPRDAGSTSWQGVIT